MMQQIDIICGKGEDAYRVSIIGENLRCAFANACADTCAKDKSGEERVSALVALGGVSALVRRKDGEFKDGPQGEPALVTFNTNGTVHAVRHFKNGVLHDSAKELAVLQFDHPVGGKLIYAASFADGKRIKRLTEQEIAAYQAGGRKRSPISRFGPKAA
jgi:hypothetical protein